MPIDGQNNCYASFDALVHRHADVIRAVCWKISSKDEERCRDLMQEVLVSLWRYRHMLREGATAREERNWVRWHCRSVWSHHCRRPELPTVPFYEALTEEVPAEDHGDLIEGLSEGLDERERSMLGYLLQGYNIAEAGKITGLGRKNSYKVYHRMIRKMKDVVERKIR